MVNKLYAVALTAVLAGCATQAPRDGVQSWPHGRTSTGPGGNGATPTPSKPEPNAKTASLTEAPREPVPPKPKDIARAKKLVGEGTALYRKGSYDEAEKTLKQAMALYPFVAEGNLTLGKIFLIRGSASRDPAMIESARLMFEMARAMGGDSREAEMLLELFGSVPE